MSSQKQHFDKLAHRYDSYKSGSNLYYKVLKEAIRQQITKKSARILDIGCGTGNFLESLNPHTGIGVDISSEMIRTAKHKYKRYRNLSFYTHDIEQKPILGTFDYILFIDVIEHLNMVNRAIKNIHDSMQKNTRLILSMANPAWEFLLILFEKAHLKMPEGPHYRISEADFQRILARYSLQILRRHVYFPHIDIPIIQNLGLIYVYTIEKVGKKG